MKKIIFTLFLLLSSLGATVIDQYPTQKLIDSGMPIIDIRTPPEWQGTGILKGAITIMFFRADGSFDIKDFLSKLNKKVDTKKTFAIICRTSSRTTQISKFLSKEFGYKVINLSGGMVYAKSKNLSIVPYK